jgi:hypothetical protein
MIFDYLACLLAILIMGHTITASNSWLHSSEDCDMMIVKLVTII